MTSVCEAEAVQGETRPDGERPGEEMGDFPGKENVGRDGEGGCGGDREQREEADGAADAENLGFAMDLSETASGLNGSLAEDEITDDAVTQQEEDTESVDLSFVQMNAELVVDNSTDTSVTPASPPRRMKGPCSCDSCKDRRELLTEQLEEVTRLQGLWMELRQHIRSIFKAAMDIPRNPNSPRSQYDKARLMDMHDIVIQLCKRDPHQLFMRLEGQAQEFVVEAKVRLLELLHNRNVNNLAEIFLTGLLDGYDALLSAASQLSGLVESLQNEHLCKFNLTWECLNKRLYQSCVYTDPLVQNNLPPFIGQLRKLLPLKGAEYQGLVHRYLAFDDEMTRIGDMWPETERLIDKYNQEQAALKAKQRMLREDWELFKARRKLIQQRMWNKTANELREFDEQLLTLASLGAVGALSPNGGPPSPGSDLGLDSLNLPLDPEILESLVQDSNKSTHLRLADMMGALTATEGQLGPNGQNDGPPVSPAGHCNEPEYWFGYECAVNHVLTYGFVTPPPSPRSISPANGERGDGEGSEGEEDIGSEEQRCECHVCTVPLMSPTRIGKGPPINVNLHSRDYSHFPPISNGFSGPTNCKAENGTMDINGVYPHLYNLHSAFGTPVKPSFDASSPSVNKNDEKTSPFGPQTKNKPEEVDSRTKLPEEVENNVEDTDLRKAEVQPCPCVYQHAKDIAERKKEMLENPPCPCLLKSKKKWDLCPCLKKTREDSVVANGHSEAQSLAAPAAKATSEARKPVIRPVGTQSAQTQTRHSTTQTPNTTHSHAPLQGPTHAHAHGPLPDLVKGTGSAHRAHSHNHAPHACHKQANVEHIKRLSCNDLAAGDGDCSDSGSSQEDSCSTSSSTPRDSSRHCDCCYCEVFGHGVPSVAPVSRNYNEMRERLRQLLTKKKAKKCKSTCSPPKSPVEAPVTEANSNPNVGQPAPRPNTPVSTIPVQQLDQRDQRDLEALLEFIEGNQNGKRDNKKAEKKARQKQKKMEEKLKKDKQEVERQRLIELQKKTPEVTITVVDPQKPVPQRLLPLRTLPEVSILPASAPAPVPRQSNNKKKDKATDHGGNNDKAKAANATSNARTKAEASVDRVDGSQKSKNNKVDASKSRAQTTVNVTNVKNSSSNSQTAATTTATSVAAAAKSAKASKKERQKLKREEAKAKDEALLKEPAKVVQAESQPQIVTIKRVMESNSAEPTVTITLKGQTPAEDKVLFTLVNGQTKETSQKSEQNSNAGGKKKKSKGGNNQQQQSAKSSPAQHQQQNNVNLKQRQSNTNDNKGAKQQQSSNEKAKSGKLLETKKQQSTIDAKSTRSKKERKNTENKENVQQQNNANKGKNQEQQQNTSNKKQKKASATTVSAPKQQQQQLNATANSETQNKKSKGQPQERNNQTNNNNNNKSKNSNNNNSNANKPKNEPQKSQNKVNQNAPKQQNAPASYNAASERRNSPLSSQFKDIGANSKINIENLKLPPGITITKVDAPAKPLPIRSAPMPKPVNPPKQTTIIAAPMSGVQSSYANPQSGGNVIVVDTGKLKQDLLPKSNERVSPRENQQVPNPNGKKKKKKGKNGSNNNNASVARNNTANATPANNGDRSDEPARILHNPGSNMVTIRNPAFGPPKMEPTQQAAIIKVSENGMVTIRSPALQQAINAGLTPPPKPDFIVKGDLSTVTKVTANQQSPAGRHNGMISSNLSELRSRLTPDCTGLTGLANIQISKVTSGQPIPENGINLKGTSVTLTKVRNEAVMDDVQQAKTAVREAISATMAASGSGKGKKKKKKGNGSRQSGDDWNLVESVFTPKDIDPEDGEMDDAERELEAFKRFCLQSVPPARKEKVNLNIKDIVLKKKSSAAVIAAN